MAPDTLTPKQLTFVLHRQDCKSSSIFIFIYFLVINVTNQPSANPTIIYEKHLCAKSKIRKGESVGKGL